MSKMALNTMGCSNNEMSDECMSRIEISQKKFYNVKFKEFNDDPKSLSWNDSSSQYLRFKKISELFKYEGSKYFTVHEVGCGLAHFHDYLVKAECNAIYSGSDIVPEFLDCCREKYPELVFYTQNISNDYDKINDGMKWKDYYCLSGTFNSKGDILTKNWEAFINKSIKNMFRMANKGICFNFLTKYAEFFDEKLYYADPKEIMDWSIKNLSRFVAISQDTPLYEFIVYVYKDDFIKNTFLGYDRYF